MADSTYKNIHNYLIQRCLEGDKRAQKELYGLYVDAMFNICRRILGNDEDARDVLQEAFITAFTNLKNFRGDATFGAWLKRIVVNKCISHLNKKKLLISELNESTEIPVEASDYSDEDIKYEAKKVMKAIEKLPKGCKTVLNLYLFEGYDHKEIAEILGVTESTSKAQYSKARKKLRQILTDEKLTGRRLF